MEKTEFVRSIEVGADKAKLIPDIISAWWKEVSKEASSDATPGKLYSIGNYLVELVRSSLGDGKSDGKVTATFDHEKIQIEIEAFSGEGREINLNVGGNYGLKETIEYADDFIIESNGKLWEKTNTRALLEENGESDVQAGSKVTFMKYIVVPVEEEDDEEEEDERYMGNRKW